MAEVVNLPNAPSSLDWKSWDDFPAPARPMGVTIVAAVFLIYAAAVVLVALGSAFAFSAIDFLQGAGIVAAIVLLLIGLAIYLPIAWGLLRLKNWARMAAVFLSVLTVVVSGLRIANVEATVVYASVLIPLAAMSLMKARNRAVDTADQARTAWGSFGLVKWGGTLVVALVLIGILSFLKGLADLSSGAVFLIGLLTAASIIVAVAVLGFILLWSLLWFTKGNWALVIGVLLAALAVFIVVTNLDTLLSISSLLLIASIAVPFATILYLLQPSVVEQFDLAEAR